MDVDVKAYESNGKKVVNLCNHDIYVLTSGDIPKTVRIPQSGIVARVEKTGKDVESFGEFNIFRDTYGDVFGLPAPEKNTLYVVSAQVLNALNNTRKDVVAVANQIKSGGKTVVADGFRRKF